MRRALRAAAAALLLAGCSRGLGPEDSNPAALAGTWVSTMSSQFVLLTLRAEDGGVRGTGEVETRGEYKVEGTYRAPEVRLVLARQTPIRLEGVIRNDTLDATWHGGPYDGRRILLVRDVR